MDFIVPSHMNELQKVNISLTQTHTHTGSHKCTLLSKHTATVQLKAVEVVTV